MSGLTVGYLSIDQLDLEIKQAIGTPAEKKAVRVRLSLISIGFGYIANFEKTSLFAGDPIAIECHCDGSLTNISGRPGSFLLGSTYICDSSSLLWRDHSLSYMHRSPVVSNS